MPLAPRDPGNRNDDKPVGCDFIRSPSCGASDALAEPEIRHAEAYGMNTWRVDGEPLAEQFSRISAVGGDLGARPEHAETSNREPFERRLGFVDLGAMDGHQQARLRKMP